MKRNYTIAAFLLVFISNVLYAADEDTTRILVHDHVDMTWYGNYDVMGTFPDDSKTYRQILLNYTMGCASTGCSDWDYTTKIELLNPTGAMDSSVTAIDTTVTPHDTTWSVYEIKEPFELARVITPYGGYMANGSSGYNNSWEHVHTFDITDYASILQNDKEIRAHYSGWSSGFSATLEFIFIEGTPPRDPLKVENIWRVGAGYNSSSDFESNHLPAKDVSIDAAAANSGMRVYVSGHGFDNSVGCAEFCERTYNLKVDGSIVGENLMWKDDCGLNPIYPQGGTWIYDRANWCPGSRVPHYDHDLTQYVTPGGTNNIDLSIQNYSWSGTQAPSYIIDAQLFSYGTPNFTRDAMLSEIISPSLADDYLRLNPICNHAVVEVQNTGSDTITSMKIEYGVAGGATQTYEWTGSLTFLETEIIELSMKSSYHWEVDPSDPKTFSADIIEVNGSLDENVNNNKQTSEYEHAPSYGNQLEVWIKTNSVPSETSWTLEDAEGNIIGGADSFDANTQYKDTFDLDDGCYVLRVMDSDGDGLSFWANSDGSGYALLKQHNGSIIKNFGGDWGSEITHHFTVGYSLGQEELIENESLLEVYPNPSTGMLNVDVVFAEPTTAEVMVTNIMGQTVLTRSLKRGTEKSFQLNLENQPAGMYWVSVRTETSSISKKVVIR